MKSISSKDPFVSLGVSVSASPAAVRSAFRRKALLCHPDRCPDDPEGAKAKFEHLTWAKELLLDVDRRAEFIERRRTSSKRHATKAAASAGDERVRQARGEAARRRMAAAEKAAKAAADLGRREAAARKARERAEEEATEAKRRRLAAIAAQAEREKVLAWERRKASLFYGWLRRKQTKSARACAGANASVPRESHASAVGTDLIAGSLASSGLPHASATDEPGVGVAPVVGGMPVEVREASSSLPGKLDAGDERHDDRGASGGQPKAAKSQKRLHGLEKRHHDAIERLQRRREAGDGPGQQVGSWWVQDEEAERYARWLDPYCS